MQGTVKRGLVLACGNSQRSDDGAGPAVAEYLRRGDCRPGIEISSCGQWTPELSEPISKMDIVVFVDASEDVPPGVIGWRQLQPAQLPAESLTHHTTPESLLWLAQELYGKHPERAYLVTVGGDSFELGEELSASVCGAIPNVAERVKTLLSAISLP